MKTIHLLACLFALAFVFVGPSQVNAQTKAVYSGPVAVVVAIPIPAGLSRAAIEAQFTALVPTYQALPGLKQKYFTVNDTKAGGIYLWTNRASADAFYTDAWRATVQKAYGVAPEVTYFDAPLIIQGKAGMETKRS